jgi:methionyl-tRNA synthetase
MDQGLLHEGILVALELASRANGYVEEQAPWTLAKDPARAGELDRTLASLARALLVLATLLQPILPGKMRDLVQRLGVQEVPTLEEALDLQLEGRTVRRGDPLFPRADLGG